jgi:hypothetical protein
MSEEYSVGYSEGYQAGWNAAIDATPPAAPVQEPVHQWQQKHSPYWYDGYPDNDDGGGPYETRTLYTTPPAAQRQWVGLTDEDKKEWVELMPDEPKPRHIMNLINVIEVELKEKNT